MSEFSLKSWSNVKPNFRFLKEVLQHQPKEKIEELFVEEYRISLSDLDTFMIAESAEFLRLSVINLLAYKNLVCGNYLAWGKVTMYYSQFYIINCLLRLKRYALVHLEFSNGESALTVSIFKPRNKSYYRVQKCTASGHQIAWDKFAEKYPELSGHNVNTGKELGKFFIKERNEWNYDLFYASQTTDEYALREARDRCIYNFLDPEYGSSASSEGAAENYNDMMANYGYEEAGTGQYQEYAIRRLMEIGKISEHSGWYLSCFSEILNDIKLLQSPASMKEEISKWFIDAISGIKKSTD